MPELVIKYKSAKALRALKDFAKYFDIEIKSEKKKNGAQDKAGTAPIIYAKNPNFMALAGIWKGKDITLKELRKEAWGDRL